MRLVCITHATGEKTHKEYFSGLTTQGCEDVVEAAKRFRSCPGNVDALQITTIVSSPHARCIETAIHFARAISGFSAATPRGYPQVCPEIRTLDDLREEVIMPSVLNDAAVRGGVGAVLLATHNNLFKALPDVARKALNGWVDSQEFFVRRPVVVLLDYENGVWKLRYCAGCDTHGWLEQSFSASGE